MAGRIRTVLEMIKFEHSVFALPFALTGALLAARATLHKLARCGHSPMIERPVEFNAILTRFMLEQG